MVKRPKDADISLKEHSKAEGRREESRSTILCVKIATDACGDDICEVVCFFLVVGLGWGFWGGFVWFWTRGGREMSDDHWA